MKRPFICHGALLLSALALVAASGHAAPATCAAKGPPIFKTRVQPLLNQHCVACHMSGGESGGLNMEPSKSYQALVGVKSTEAPAQRVVPGHPEKSYIIAKLTGTHVKMGGSGTAMPPDGALDSQDIALITSWIKDCANSR